MNQNKNKSKRYETEKNHVPKTREMLQCRCKQKNFKANF